jgi:phospholipase C
VRNDPAQCSKIVPLTQLSADLQDNQLPDYTWITPNLCNDMHDCPVSTGDAWLKTWVPRILASPAWKQDGVLFIVFDEGVSDAGCCQYASGGKVGTLVISPLVRAGTVSQVAYDHYSLLRTVEQAWGLPLLANAACDCSPAMTDFFNKPD